jgi:hypothetical protein
MKHAAQAAQSITAALAPEMPHTHAAASTAVDLTGSHCRLAFPGR